MNNNFTGSANPTDISVRGPSLRLSSSTGLGWKDIAIERHIIEPGEKSASAISDYIVELASGSEVSYGERPNRRRHFMPYSKPPGTLNLYVEESLPAIYPTTKTDLIVCALDPRFVRRAAEELSGPSTVDLREQIGFRDEAVADLIGLLEAEAKSGGISGSLYVDHLVYALTLRLLSGRTPREDGRAYHNRLPHARLRRVVERMEADLSTDLDLKTLAGVSGYSINHFLRMFLAATGFSPHQYLLRLRVKRAQALMKDRSTRLIDVALACGFSSHAHLSRMFRQVIGASPSEYRRGIL
jgi:AraC family transcriptional regulator